MTLDHDTRSTIIRSLSDLLEDAFSIQLEDHVAEALYRQGIDTLEDADAQDLALSLKIEALEHFLAEYGWQLAPRTTPLLPQPPVTELTDREDGDDTDTSLDR